MSFIWHDKGLYPRREPKIDPWVDLYFALMWAAILVLCCL